MLNLVTLSYVVLDLNHAGTQTDGQTDRVHLGLPFLPTVKESHSKNLKLNLNLNSPQESSRQSRNWPRVLSVPAGGKVDFVPELFYKISQSVLLIATKKNSVNFLML